MKERIQDARIRLKETIETGENKLLYIDYDVIMDCLQICENYMEFMEERGFLKAKEKSIN